MRCRQATDISCGEGKSEEKNLDASREKLRLYKRQYMRRWRASPSRQAGERECRRRAHYVRKARRAQLDSQQDTNLRGERVCGYCGIRPAVEDVVRLQICEPAPDGYVEVLIPYCGQC